MGDSDVNNSLPDAKVYIKVQIYDMLPVSYLSNLLNTFSTGVYHSSITLDMYSRSLKRVVPAEIAFGGHDSPGTTGIFIVPVGTTLDRMPGLKLYYEMDKVECFGLDWINAFMPKRQRNLRREKISESSLSSSENLIAEEEQDIDHSDDGGMSDGTEVLTMAQRRIYRLIEAMKKETEWQGCRYNLLAKNCNHFIAELYWRLTGMKNLGWINRAAFVATSSPCLVPEGWIDSEDMDVIDEERALDVIVVPPRADQMSMSVHRV